MILIAEKASTGSTLTLVVSEQAAACSRVVGSRVSKQPARRWLSTEQTASGVRIRASEQVALLLVVLAPKQTTAGVGAAAKCAARSSGLTEPTKCRLVLLLLVVLSPE